jgi:DNA-binding MarR family transcriptional regulator
LSQADATLLEIVSRGEWTINGFRNADLRKQIYPSRSPSPQQARRRSAAVSRKLRLLRAHGLIKKIPGSHRYLLTVEGRKLITLLMAARKADIDQLTAFAA